MKRHDLDLYSFRAIDESRGVNLPKMAFGALTLIGGTVVASYLFGFGLSLLFYPLVHPVKSLIIGGIGYGVWKWMRR